MKHIAGKALRVNTHEGRRVTGQLTHTQSHGFFGLWPGLPFETIDPEEAELRREIGFGNFLQLKRCTGHRLVRDGVNGFIIMAGGGTCRNWNHHS